MLLPMKMAVPRDNSEHIVGNKETGAQGMCRGLILALLVIGGVGTNPGPPKNVKVLRKGVSKEDQLMILDAHNRLRHRVAKGQETQGRPGPQPPAADMRKLFYDKELAAKAQKWTNECTFEHDDDEKRKVARFRVGQNLYTSKTTDHTDDGKPDWNQAIQAWYDEVAIFNTALVSKFRTPPRTMIGHYTQLVWADTYLVGAGYIYYQELNSKWYTKLYTCDYGPTEKSPFFPSRGEQVAIMAERRMRLAEERDRAAPPTPDSDVILSPFYPSRGEQMAFMAERRMRLAEVRDHVAPPTPDSDVTLDDSSSDSEICCTELRNGQGLESYERFKARRVLERPIQTTEVAREMPDNPGPSNAIAGWSTGAISRTSRTPRAIMGRGLMLGTPGRDFFVATSEKNSSLNNLSAPSTSGASSGFTATFNNTQHRFNGMNITEAAPSSNGRDVNPCMMPVPKTRLIVAGGSASNTQIYSRKVFVGGLPADIADKHITQHFQMLGRLTVDWPHKTESKGIFPPKGFAFLRFQEESSVRAMLEAATRQHNQYFTYISTPDREWKRLEIIPWLLKDVDFSLVPSEELNTRTTVFVGGVPRPCTAEQLAVALNSLFSGVVYAGIDTDIEFQYPKGSGRVCFSNYNCFVNAISARFIEINIGNTPKRIEIKPYVMDEQICDICHGQDTVEQFASFFCPNVKCLNYHCSSCWAKVHCSPDMKFHKPLIKETRHGSHDMSF